MSRIDELVLKHCPHGVEFKTLGELGTFVRGNGLQKSDLTSEGMPAIHYGQIHTKYETWTTQTVSFVSPVLGARLRQAAPGDLVIATTSEDDAAVGKAVAWLGTSPAAVSGDAYVYHHTLNPKYVAYFFESDQFAFQKRFSITGTKVKRLSGDSIAKIKIPVPPLEIQKEIVRVLDTFAELEAELEAELDARIRQYAYYRTDLLDFPESVPRVALGAIAYIGTGSRNTNEAVMEGKYPFFVRSQEPLTIDDFEFDETAIITAGDGVGVGKVFHFVRGKYGLHQRAYRIVVSSDRIMPEFLFHYIRNDFAKYLAMTSVHASVTSLRKPMFENYLVPVPPLDTQRRVAGVLESFDSLIGDLSIGLPAELTARREQYEYYRDNLLAFKELADE